jgi:hypothetical protein
LNAERLNVVAKTIQQELTSTRVVENLTELTTALQNLVNQPGNAQFQQIVTSKRNEIGTALKSATSNSFSPAWRQVVTQIGGEGLLGGTLEERLRTIFERNQITPTNALQEIRQIQQSLTNFKNGIDQTVGGLNLLRIGTEDLAPGEAEIGVEIPRGAVNNDLAGLEKELGELKFILGTFLELSTGSPGPISLRTISSTDLQFYFSAVPSAAAALAYALNLLVDSYKKIVEIRKKHSELKENGVPPEVLKPLEDYANRAIEDKLDHFAVEIESKHFHVKDGNRRNELKVALKFSLAKLANRIDRGYHVEVRIASTPAPTDAKGKKETGFEDAVATIGAAADSMQYIRLEGAPILSLPESDHPKRDIEKKGSKKS